MRRLLAPALVGLLLAGTAARAQDRYVPSTFAFGGGSRYSRPPVVPCPPYSVGPYTPGVPSVPGMPVDPNAPRMDPPIAPPGTDPIMPPETPAPNPIERRLIEPFAQATEAGGLAPRAFNENFDGDFGGVFYRRRITIGYTVVPQVVGFTQRVAGYTPVTTTTTQTTGTDQLGRPIVTTTITTTNNPIIVNDPITVNTLVAQQRIIRQTLAGRYSGVLISDNDNPRPQDRIYGGYNFYDNIGGSLNPGMGQTDLQRETVGFEKTFLGGDASFGMRMPFVQQYGPPGVGGTQNVGDLSLLFKYAFYNNRETGDLISGGLILTVPTGSGDAILLDGTKAPHSVLFQPWGGFVRTFDRAFVQGITSLIVPTKSSDPTLWNNSVGFGYYLYRTTNNAAWLTSVAPVVEVHVRTPLTQRNPDGLVYLQDQVNITSGMRFRFNRASFSASVGVPVIGPRPWGVEAMSFFNYSF